MVNVFPQEQVEARRNHELKGAPTRCLEVSCRAEGRRKKARGSITSNAEARNEYQSRTDARGKYKSEMIIK